MIKVFPLIITINLPIYFKTLKLLWRFCGRHNGTDLNVLRAYGAVAVRIAGYNNLFARLQIAGRALGCFANARVSGKKNNFRATVPQFDGNALVVFANNLAA